MPDHRPDGPQASEPTVYCPDDCDGPECDCPPRVGGACREHAWKHAAGHLHAQCDRMRRGLLDAQRHVCPSPDWYGKVRQLVSDTALAAGFTGPDLATLPAYISALQLDRPELAQVLNEPIDIVGGSHAEPGDTELDDAIEQIVGDYIPDSLLRAQLSQRILAEVLRRTPIDDPYTRPAASGGRHDS